MESRLWDSDVGCLYGEHWNKIGLPSSTDISPVLRRALEASDKSGQLWGFLHTLTDLGFADDLCLLTQTKRDVVANLDSLRYAGMKATLDEFGCRAIANRKKLEEIDYGASHIPVDSVEECNSSSESFELEMKAAAWEEVLRRSKNELSGYERELNDKMTELCEEKIKFIEELNNFDETFGIMSSWWSAQMFSLQDPLIGKNAEHRNQLKCENDHLFNEIDHLQKVNKRIESEIAKIKEKMVEDEATLLHIQASLEDLKTQPFGPKFISLRAAFQESKENCEKLGALVGQNSKVNRRSKNITSAERQNFAESNNPRESYHCQNVLYPTVASEDATSKEKYPQNQWRPRSENPTGAVFKFYETTTLAFKVGMDEEMCDEDSDPSSQY